MGHNQILETVRFERYGLNGNTFVVIDEALPDDTYRSLAAVTCDRAGSAIADSLLVVSESAVADVRMRIFERDGTESDMCGNGARCIALRHSTLVGTRQLTIETSSGIVRTCVRGGSVDLHAGRLQDPTPHTTREGLLFDEDILVIEDAGRTYYLLSIGEPHLIAIGDVDSDWSDAIAFVQDRSAFPRGMNLNIMDVTGPDTIRLSTFERGVWRYTESCGTGSICAAALARLMAGAHPRAITVHNDTGTQRIIFTRDGIVARGTPVFLGSGTIGGSS